MIPGGLEGDTGRVTQRQCWRLTGSESVPGLFDEIDGVLIVVEVDVIPLDRFSRIFSLFDLENGLVEILLQLFVGIVDTKLLEAVYLHKIEREREKS